MEKQFEFAWQSGVFLVACLVLFFLAKILFKVFNPKLDVSHELVDNDNLAFYMAYVLYFLGIIMIVGGVMNSEGSGDFWQEILYTFIYGLVGIVSLNVITFVRDKFIHSSHSLWEEIIKNTKVSIGILKGANYLSVGIIIAGVLMTEVDKPIQAGLFLIFALVIATLGFVYYNIITPFNSKTEIYDGNIAVAISAGGAQVAFAILIYAGFQIEHTTWQESLIGIVIEVIGGFILLPIIRLVVDKVFIPKHRKVTDEMVNQVKPNIGLGIFEATAYIGGALLFIWCWNL